MRLLVIGAAGMLGQDLLAAAEAAGHEPVGLGPARDRHHRRRRDAREGRGAAPRRGRQLRGVDRRRRGRGPGGARRAGERGGRRQRRRRGARPRRARDPDLDRLLVRRHGHASRTWSPARPAPLGAYGRTKLAGELAVSEAATPDFAIVRSSWLFGPHGKNFVDTMLRLGAERDEVSVVDDQVGCPTYTGHLAPALVEIADRRLTGVLHVAGGGDCSWYDLAVAAFERTGTQCVVNRTTAAEFGRPAPRPAYSVLRTERDDAPRLPPWEEGLAAHLASLEGAHEAARLRRCRLHRLDVRAPARARVRRRGDGAGQADLRRPPGEPRTTSSTAFVHAGIEEPRAGRRGDRRRRRGGQLRRRDARRPLDRRAGRVRDHPRARHLRAARGRPRAGRPLRAGLHRRGVRLDRGGLVHRDLARWRRPRRTAPPRRAPTCWSPPTGTRSGWRR